MNKYRLSQIASLFGVDCINSNQEIEVLLTDSRNLNFPSSTLFFALITDKGNGHNYVYDLLKKGVRAFFVSQTIPEEWKSEYPEATFIMVADTLEALHRVAAWKRSLLAMTVIGITGSNGKTILKELLYQLLKDKYRVGRSPKSYNSSVGVPLSMWTIDEKDQWAMIEAGISKPHEMERLHRIIQPNWGVITHLGEAHQENFGTFEEKTIEKLKLFVGCEKVFAPYDETLIRETLESLRLPSSDTLFWSKHNKSCDLYISSITYYSTYSEVILILKGREMKVHLPFLDEGTLHSCFMAMLILSEIDLELALNPQIYEELSPISMRLEVLEGRSNTLVINDTYSSDYDSLKIALDFMRRRNSDHFPTALILSDMQDSSASPDELYHRVAELVNQYQLDKIILVGDELGRYRHLFKGVAVTHCSHINELSESYLLSYLQGHIILLKGARVAQFEKVVERLKLQTHQTILHVNLSRLAHNLNQHRALLPPLTKITCMIKADGYGLGAYEVAKTLQRQGVDYLAVAVVDEGQELRARGIHTPIIVMNPEVSAFEQLIKHDLQPEIYSLSLLRKFATKAGEMNRRGYPIHLKWDTGMHRLGLSQKDIPELMNILQDNPVVQVASIFTHLAAADDPCEDEFTRGQLLKLDAIYEELTSKIGYRFIKHALNTAGILRFPNYPCDMVRLGIGLYGFSPIAHKDFGLEPVAELQTVVLQIQDIGAGETVGYSRRGRVTRPSRIGIIPIGYADGISRQLGNGRARFRAADGTLVPTIGNICMDTTMIDLTDAPSVEEGSFVTIFGDNLSLTSLSDASSTIPYETMAGLSHRIVRKYFSE